MNKGHPNNEAIKSFNKNEGAGQGKGAQGLEAAGGAAGAGAGNKPGNLSERQGQGAAAGAGKTGNEPGNVTNRNLKTGREPERETLKTTTLIWLNIIGRALAREPVTEKKLEQTETKRRPEIKGTGETWARTRRKCTQARRGGAGGTAHGQHAMNQQMQHHQQQMGGQSSSTADGRAVSAAENGRPAPSANARWRKSPSAQGTTARQEKASRQTLTRKLRR